MPIEISNRRYKGIHTRNWLITSGGVIIPDNMRKTTIACFLYLFIKSGVTIPTFDRKYIIMGSSKAKPVDRVTELTLPIYDLRLI